MDQIYLSRRNLLTLLSKLDRARNGEATACTLIKSDNVHPTYAQSMPHCAITAVEDDQYYDRPAGDVLPADEPTGEHYQRERTSDDLTEDEIEFLREMGFR